MFRLWQIAMRVGGYMSKIFISMPDGNVEEFDSKQLKIPVRRADNVSLPEVEVVHKKEEPKEEKPVSLGACSFCKQETLSKTSMGVHCDTCGKNEVR